MAIIDVEPIVLTDCIIEIAGSDFAAAINSAVFTPSSSTVTFRGMKPSASFSKQTLATWVLALSFAQDWETAGSLSQYLFANEGNTVEAVFKPQSGSGPSFEAQIIVTPGAIGGAGEAVAVSTVTLGVSGKPELVPAV